MSNDDDDDSSLQFRKLLSSGTPSNPSTDSIINSDVFKNDDGGTSGNDDGDDEGEDDDEDGGKDVNSSPPTTDMNRSSQNDSGKQKQQQQQQKQLQQKTLANKNPENCYSWLLHGRDRKFSDGALSSSRASTSSSSTSSSSSSDSSFPSLPLPPPPDGGWGWMVVFGAFLILFICDGLAYCFGVIYYELLVQFGESRSKTSLVGSIFFGVSMILGPFASAMTTRFGCRKMTIVGGILSFVGFVMSYFATSVDMLCFTFSVVVGTGFSFCYVTSAVVVHFYFDKRRSLATGVSVCGTGVGTFTFAPLVEYLIGEYGLRGMFLIMAAISLNLVVAGMLFISLKFTEEERWQHYFAEFDKLPHGRESLELGRLRNVSESTDNSSDCVDVIDEDSRTMSMLSLPTFISPQNHPTDPSSEILREALRNSKNPHLTYMRYMKNVYLRSKGEEEELEKRKMKKKLPKPRHDETVTISIEQIDPCVSNSNTLSEDPHPGTCLIPKKNAPPNNNNVQQQLTLQQQHQQNTKNNTTKTPSETKLLQLGGENPTNNKSSSFLDISNAMRSQSISKLVSGMHIGGKHTAMGMQLLLYRTDIFYRRQLNQPTLDNNQPCLLGTSCPELIVEPSEDKPRGKLGRVAKTLKSETSDILRSMVNFSLFRNVFFTVFVVSNFMFYFWNDIPYMFAADHSVSQGISLDKASFLISIVGISNAVGQLVFGIIGDTNCNLINVYAIALFLSGVFTAVVPLMETFWSVALVYAFFGFFVAVNFPFVSVLLVNYLGVEQLTNAYGLLMLMQGLANVLGPPFAGWIADETGTYNGAFYLSGLFYALSGLIMYVILVPRCRVQKVESDVTMEVKPPGAGGYDSDDDDDEDDDDYGDVDGRGNKGKC